MRIPKEIKFEKSKECFECPFLIYNPCRHDHYKLTWSCRLKYLDDESRFDPFERPQKCIEENGE